jgi:hypothetical protein
MTLPRAIWERFRKKVYKGARLYEWQEFQCSSCFYAGMLASLSHTKDMDREEFETFVKQVRHEAMIQVPSGKQ